MSTILDEDHSAALVPRYLQASRPFSPGHEHSAVPLVNTRHQQLRCGECIRIWEKMMLFVQAADFFADEDSIAILIHQLCDRMFPHDHEHPAICAQDWEKPDGREYHLRSRVVPAPRKRPRLARRAISSSSCRFCESRQAQNGKVRLIHASSCALACARALWCCFAPGRAIVFLVLISNCEQVNRVSSGI